MGWAVLPLFAVRKEILEGRLAVVPDASLPDEEVGIWWLASRTTLQRWIEHAANWLTSLSLS